jgi:hypothetical protein
MEIFLRIFLSTTQAARLAEAESPGGVVSPRRLRPILYLEGVVAKSANGPYRHGNGSCVKVFVAFAACPAWLSLSR